MGKSASILLSRAQSKIGHVKEYPTMYCTGILRNTQPKVSLGNCIVRMLLTCSKLLRSLLIFSGIDVAYSNCQSRY